MFVQWGLAELSTSLLLLKCNSSRNTPTAIVMKWHSEAGDIHADVGVIQLFHAYVVCIGGARH
jgi:hypothetical protein